MDEDSIPSVAIIGGGVAGLSAAIYTARVGMETTVFDGGDSLLARNAHLENYPGFPGGVNARLLLEMMADQAERAGTRITEGIVTAIEATEAEGFEIEVEDRPTESADRVIAATKNEVGYLVELSGVTFIDRGKPFVDVDERGRSGHPGVYVAGRLAEQPHQAIVNAGHGATVALTLIEDADVPFYHDWVAPTGYFTDRDRPLPPGCEEIDEEERNRREKAAIETMQAYFEQPHPSEQPTHPSLD